MASQVGRLQAMGFNDPGIATFLGGKMLVRLANPSKKLRVSGNIFSPKVIQKSAHIIRLESPRLTTAKVAYSHRS